MGGGTLLLLLTSGGPSQVVPIAIDPMLWFLLNGSGASPPVSPGFDFDLASYLAANLPYKAYPVHLPQQVDPSVPILPCYTYAIVRSEDFNSLGGYLGLCSTTYQFSIWALAYRDTVLMAESLRTKLQNFRGQMGLSTVLSCLRHNQLTLDESPVDSSDQWTYHRVVEFKIVYRQSS